MKTFYLLPLILLMSCGSTKKPAEDKAQKSVQEKIIDFKTIAQASLHGNGAEGIDAGLYTIKDKKAWKELLAKMNSVNDETKKFTDTNIDFEKQMVVAVFDRVLGAGGVKINIDKIIEPPGNVQVVVSHKRPQGGFATMVMNQPYHIVVLPKIDKEFEMKALD